MRPISPVWRPLRRAVAAVAVVTVAVVGLTATVGSAQSGGAADPKGIVKFATDLQVHGVRGLYVADGFACIESSPGKGVCFFPNDDGGCCSVANDDGVPWAQLGFAAMVFGLIFRARRR